MNIVSFGGGLNSTAMILGMYNHDIPIDIVLFADTGGEHPHTYEFIDIFSKWLVAHGLPSITTVHYTKRNGDRLMLEDECLNSKTLPSIAYGYKTCSLKHKIGPQEKYCNNNPDCKALWAASMRVKKYIGYDAGEKRRLDHVTVRDREDNKYENHYLLYEWGWDREHCASIIESAGLPYPGKSSCFFCPSMKKHEIQSLWAKYPHLFQRAIDIEHAAAETNTTVKGLGRSWSWESYYNTFMEAKQYEDAQLTLFGFEETVSGCICGAPCGCYDG